MKNMKKLTILCAVALSSVCLFQSCSDDDDDAMMTNQEFVTQASSSNSFEIQSGELANTKGQNPLVTAFGAHMVMDHTTAAQELAPLAQQKGWTLSQQLLKRHQDNLNMLTPLTGAAFDKEFARLMVVSHEEAVSLFRSASSSNGVPDSDLRSWAAGKLPKLEQHLEEARDLNDAIN
jgi:putative membrane protein